MCVRWVWCCTRTPKPMVSCILLHTNIYLQRARSVEQFFILSPIICPVQTSFSTDVCIVLSLDTYRMRRAFHTYTILKKQMKFWSRLFLYWKMNIDTERILKPERKVRSENCITKFIELVYVPLPRILTKLPTHINVYESTYTLKLNLKTKLLKPLVLLSTRVFQHSVIAPRNLHYVET